MAALRKAFRLSLASCAALIFAVSTAAHGQGEANGRPSSTTVIEFANACRGLAEINRVRATLAIQGWQRIGLNESALIESLVSGWENSPVGENAEKRSEHEAYAKSIAGRTALLLIKDYDTPHSGSIARWTTCDLFDFAEAPFLNDLHAVLGEQRVEARHEPYFPDATADSLVGISWHEPYSLEGSTITNVKTVPAEYYGVSFVNYSSVKWFDREPPGDLRWPSPPSIPPPPVQLPQQL